MREASLVNRLCVIGSLNTDLVARVARFPAPGETLRGASFATFPGGKGANQAVAAARLGAEVCLVGKLGEDGYGRSYLDHLKLEKVDTSGLALQPGVSSGVALIMIDESGENTIVVVPGANLDLDAGYLRLHEPLLESHDLFLLQLEIPLDTVGEACRLLHSGGKRVILDPAPAIAVPPELYEYVDIVTPNEHELAALTGMRSESLDETVRAASRLIESGAKTVVVKRGRAGAVIVTAEGSTEVRGFEVSAVDTTGAGDAFNGGLAVALSEGMDMAAAVRFANAVGALTTTAIGAQSAMPRRAEVDSLLARR